jgi:hypothetical protein
MLPSFYSSYLLAIFAYGFIFLFLQIENNILRLGLWWLAKRCVVIWGTARISSWLLMNPCEFEVESSRDLGRRRKH